MRPHDPFLKVRIARPTDRLADIVAFYRDAVGLTVLGAFVDHDGVDGALLGFAGATWHLEFTHLPDADAFEAARARMARRGHAAVAALNPYWDRIGRTYEDPDGYRVVLAHAAGPTDGSGGP